ncbi:MAG: hypothetical protein HRU03_00865 [Nanoarchaeales archaeon]|nr:hypothetical protein [Nanoarchaeales archaeon]
MNYIKSLKQLFIFVLFLNLGACAFAFPEFSFSQSSYGSGEVDVTFSASRGVRVSLYANDNFVESIDVLSAPVEVLLEGELSDIILPVNSNLIFKNLHPTRVYTLSIPGVMATTLNPGDTSSQYFFDSISNYDLIDSLSGESKQIIVEDSVLGGNIFYNVGQSYLYNGENIFTFKISSPTGSFTSYDEEYNVNYDKFPNSINVNSFDNTTNERRVKLSGSVSDSSYPLYYLLNQNGPIGNTGAFIPVVLNGSRFNISVTGLSEGLNSIRFISTEIDNKYIFVGEEFANVYVDTVNPVISITNIYFSSNTDNSKKVFLSDGEINTNTNSIFLNVSADANFLNYTFNNKTEYVEMFGGTIELGLTLTSGKNSLNLIVIDDAGNVAQKAHQINYDDKGPKILLDEMGPDTVFKNKEVNFFLQNIEGKTNKGHVKIEIFSIPIGATDYSGDSVTCDDYQNLFYRSIEDRDEYTYAPISSIPDSQMSLLSGLNRESVTSDANGNFKSRIFLQEKNLDSERLEQSNNVDSVRTRNTICMILVDRFGKEKIEPFYVTFDAGNTVWEESETIVSPQNIFEGELQQSHDGERSGRGDYGVSITATFQYLGGSNLRDITSIRIKKNTKTFPDTRYITIDHTLVKFAYEKDTNLMTVYIPLEIKTGISEKKPERVLTEVNTSNGSTKMEYKSVDERDWFEEIELGFGLVVTYELDDLEVPIDTVNPVWFQTSIVIENTQDWLSVKGIERTQKLLNKTIKATEKVVKIMEKASFFGVAACLFAKGKNYYDFYTLGDDASQEDINEINRNLFIVCDRIAGLPAPYKSNLNTGESGYLKEEEYKYGVDYVDADGNVLGQFKPEVFGSCDVKTQKSVAGAGDGKWVQGDIKLFKIESNSGASRTVVENGVLKKRCEKINSDGGIDFASARGQAFYQHGAPNFDDTKCNFFGANTPSSATKENNWEGAGVSGVASSVSILSSIQCGAIVDTYSHSKNILKIFNGMNDCLEQAKIGTLKGSYCKRLFGQYACDLLTNVILPEAQQSFNKRSPIENVSDRNNGFDFFGEMDKNKKIFSDRYSGSIIGQAGLQSDQILNKACVGAITGDWSAITDNILMAIESNQVEPTLGQPFAYSRLQGYNPITGTLSVRYLYTLGVMSGGQVVNTKVELVCDPSYKDAKACPDDGVIVSSEVNAGVYKSKTFVTAKGRQIQALKIINEIPAKVWYNKMRITHTFELKGKMKIVTNDFPIEHKTESTLGSCLFTTGTLQGGAGYKCDILYHESGENTYVKLDKYNTKLIPTSFPGSSEVRPYFEGNSVFAKVDYETSFNADSNNEIEYALFYYGVCNENSDGIGTDLKIEKNGKFLGEKPLNSKSRNSSTIQIIELFKDLPSVGTSVGSMAYLTQKLEGEYYIRVFSADKTIVPNLNINEIVLDGKKIETITKEYGELGKYAIYKFDAGDKSVDGFKIYSSDDFKESKLVIDLIPALGKKVDELGILPTKIRLNFEPSLVDAGSCNVYMRALPKTSSGSIDRSNFKTYKPGSDSDSEGNIITNAKIVDNVLKTTFKLSVRPNTEKIYFSLTTPIKGQSIDVSGDTLDIPINYILQNNINKKEGEFKLKYYLKSDSYVFEDFKNSGTKLSDEFSYGFGELIQTLEIKIPDTLKKKLNLNVNSNYVSDSISGTTSITEVVLYYELVKYNGTSTKSLKTKLTGSVRFNIR